MLTVADSGLPVIVVGTSTLYDLPVIVVGTSTLYGLPVVVVGTSTLYGLPVIVVGTSTLYGLPVIVVRPVLTVGVEHVTDEPHLGGAEGVVWREAEDSREHPSFKTRVLRTPGDRQNATL